MKTAIFDLNKYRAKNSMIFTGRDKGEYVRRQSKFDKLEEENDQIKFIIPDDLFSINPSFFEELLINVVLKLGKEGFYAKYSFENRGDYNYEKPLNDAIDRILRQKNAL